MRKIAVTTFLLILGIFMAAGTAAAATTNISPGFETALTGYGGVLDQLYGWDNLTRIDDNFDQIWFPASGKATAKAKYADFSQKFGYIPDLNKDSVYDEPFEFLFNVTGNGLIVAGPSAALNSGDFKFIWAVDPSGAPMWTSLQSRNSDLLDHMVTWKITGPNDPAAASPLVVNDNNGFGSYVIAWEDLRGGGDRDFNDLVVEVNVAPVPVPPAILLLGSGLVAMIGIRRRFNS